MDGTTLPEGKRPCTGRFDLFLEHHGEPAADRDDREARAKTLCSACTIREDCLVSAISRRERGAVWGGLNDVERDLYARAIRASA